MFNGKKPEFSLNSFLSNQSKEHSDYAKKEENFINGIKIIQDKHADFFKDKEIGANDINDYFYTSNLLNKTFLEFREYNVLDDNIKSEIIDLFYSAYD
tara:strand:- start:110 stop:403 length:294 start_codon:yes stop_codon:yes gene_type:complete